MNNEDKRSLCLELMNADSEKAVIEILERVGFWSDDSVWRLYGDRENNFSTIGNQQNRPDAALVEKLINSVDARLMNECHVRGIIPQSAAAPQSIREAVTAFFEKGRRSGSVFDGQIRGWDDELRRSVAKGITLAATGPKGEVGDPCLIIADEGEGQTPRHFLDTFLSLEKSNKLRIPFVQGKFNMGGTGVLEFCGKHNFQMILSRRNPKILNGYVDHPTDKDWGFTIVRREDPQGNQRSSSYTFLAPVESNAVPQKGHVLTFTAKDMPIFPEGSQPFARSAEWGTLMKLYEYSLPGHRTHILRKSGLLARLELLIPEPALPIRLHECRVGYSGHAGSFDTTLTGLGVRLDEGGRGENIEPDFPSAGPLSVEGEEMTATIFVFKKGKADAYRRNEGILFTVNGQTHGHLTADFFRRTRVGLAYLADSILVLVDCSTISNRGRELLFMNSRDRLRGGELCRALEQELEDLLKNHSGLRSLRERRRREEIESRIEDSKPLEQVLESILKHSPTLANLFQFGKQASNPFKQTKTGAEEKPFEGKRYPTYFKFKGKNYGEQLARDIHVNQRSRIAFETDVANDYFNRGIDPGTFKLMLYSDGQPKEASEFGISSNFNLHNGIATLSVKLPEMAKIGDRLSMVAVVSDATQMVPFENRFTLLILKPVEPSGGNGDRSKPPSRKDGNDREQPGGIELPKPTPVPEDKWNEYDFNQNTALRIKDSGSRAKTLAGEEAVIFDYFINSDNVHLKRFLKAASRSKDEDKLSRTRFELGMILVALALLHHDRTTARPENPEPDTPCVPVETVVAQVTDALAPFLLPMIEALGGLDAEQVSASTASGEAT